MRNDPPVAVYAGFTSLILRSRTRLLASGVRAAQPRGRLQEGARLILHHHRSIASTGVQSERVDDSRAALDVMLNPALIHDVALAQ
jgi:hypothetical protein